MTRRHHSASAKTGVEIDLDSLADDIVGAIEALGHESAIVVGWSYAGAEMPVLARRHPSRADALVLVDALYSDHQPPEDLPPTPGSPAPNSVYPDVETVVDRLAAMLPAKRELLEQYVRGALRQDDRRRSAGNWKWEGHRSRGSWPSWVNGHPTSTTVSRCQRSSFG